MLIILAIGGAAALAVVAYNRLRERDPDTAAEAVRNVRQLGLGGSCWPVPPAPCWTPWRVPGCSRGRLVSAYDLTCRCWYDLTCRCSGVL